MMHEYTNVMMKLIVAFRNFANAAKGKVSTLKAPHTGPRHIETKRIPNIEAKEDTLDQSATSGWSSNRQ
jgi:hypothetical protein